MKLVLKITQPITLAAQNRQMAGVHVNNSGGESGYAAQRRKGTSRIAPNVPKKAEIEVWRVKLCERQQQRIRVAPDSHTSARRGLTLTHQQIDADSRIHGRAMPPPCITMSFTVANIHRVCSSAPAPPGREEVPVSSVTFYSVGQPRKSSFVFFVPGFLV